MLVLLVVAAFATSDSPAFAFPSSSSQHSSLGRPSVNRWHGARRHPCRTQRTPNRGPLFSDPGDGTDYDPNQWISSEGEPSSGDAPWDDALAASEDGALWSAFAGSADAEDDPDAPTADAAAADDDDGGNEAWLDALASIAADEVAFMSKEADRADKVRQMQELGFSTDAVASTLGVATDGARETDDANEVFEAFKEESFGLMEYDDVDLETVESHSQVEWDEDVNEPVRAQHVYVDEVTCIGCTNCASIAQSTFFMEAEQGRARVFQQWGDDDETVQIAIETCPVDCIHYVPYDELKRLEVERRDQNINHKARLVSQAEYTSGAGHQTSYGGAVAFTGQQIISGNMGARCNNCPTRGCKNCPMFGVGLNPEFKQREERRNVKFAKAEMKKKMESQNKRADL